MRLPSLGTMVWKWPNGRVSAPSMGPASFHPIMPPTTSNMPLAGAYTGRIKLAHSQCCAGRMCWHCCLHQLSNHGTDMPCGTFARALYQCNTMLGLHFGLLKQIKKIANSHHLIHLPDFFLKASKAYCRRAVFDRQDSCVLVGHWTTVILCQLLVEILTATILN